MAARRDRGSADGRAAWKARAAAAVVCVAALWPFAHRLLVGWYDVNPWKLGGWAMYTTPTPPVMVAVFRLQADRNVLVDRRRLPPRVQDEITRFTRARHALGDLLRPDAVARALFAVTPRSDVVTIVVERMSLERVSARMASRMTSYTYDRSGLRERHTVRRSAATRTPPM